MSSDNTIVCRFRNILVEADLYDMLLEEFNRQLKSKGIIVKRGAIVDASTTNTPRRPRGRKRYEVVEDRKEDENKEASEKAMLKEVVKPMWMWKLVGLRRWESPISVTSVTR